MSENFKMIAKTFYGFEDILSEELLALGAQKINKGNRNVSFYGDKGFLYKSNLSLRTTLKILKPVCEFRFKDINEYYDNIYSFKWERKVVLSVSTIAKECHRRGGCESASPNRPFSIYVFGSFPNTA